MRGPKCVQLSRSPKVAQIERLLRYIYLSIYLLYENGSNSNPICQRRPLCVLHTKPGSARVDPTGLAAVAKKPQHALQGSKAVAAGCHTCRRCHITSPDDCREINRPNGCPPPLPLGEGGRWVRLV